MDRRSAALTNRSLEAPLRGPTLGSVVDESDGALYWIVGLIYWVALPAAILGLGVLLAGATARVTGTRQWGNRALKVGAAMSILGAAGVSLAALLTR